jgi:hypothetical protein
MCILPVSSATEQNSQTLATTRAKWVRMLEVPLLRSDLVFASPPDCVDQDVLVVPSGFPHRISSQLEVLDEPSLSFKRLCVVERNHDLRGGVVNIGLIACALSVSFPAWRRPLRNVPFDYIRRIGNKFLGEVDLSRPRIYPLPSPRN